MCGERLYFLIPGDLQSGTGGYVYDRRMIDALGTLGWRVDVHPLDSSFPRPSPKAEAHIARLLDSLPEDSLVLIDALAVSPIPQILRLHAKRLRLLALLHMPLARDAGIDPCQREQVRRTEAQALKCMRHVIVTGPGSLEDLRNLGVAARRVSVIEPGTDVPGTDVPRADAALRARRSPRAPNDAVRLLCVGTLHPGKGHELLLEALHGVAGLSWQLVCVGSLTRSPETVARVRMLMDRLALASRVTLLGELGIEDVHEQYRLADLFVLPTHFESYGMAVAEALAHGLPVIGTRTGAIPKLVGDSAGVLVPCGDRMALSSALTELIRSDVRRAALARGAALVAAALPSWSDAGRQLARLLAQIPTAVRG